MAAKPNEQTILQTYTLSELLDLVRKKSKSDAEEQVNSLKQSIAALTGGESKSGSESTTGTKRGRPKGTAKKGKRGRPKGSGSTGTGKRGRPKGSGRGKNKKPLSQHVQEVVGAQPMGVEEILNAVKSNGYKSKSKDPKRVLYLELRKQANDNNLKKVGRGKYKAA